jgi:hypothetical protein
LAAKGLDCSRKGSVNGAGLLMEKTMPDSSVVRRLVSLSHLGKPALSELWHQLFKKASPPAMRRDLMIRIVAFRLQEQEFGGVSDSTCRLTSSDR